MDTHRFQDHVKVQRFCLTLTGEARLWYESLRLINIDWLGLKNIFRQQYSKIGNTREQLFHAWEILSLWWKCRNSRCLCKLHETGCHTFRLSRSTNVREVFKNTLLTKLYWVLFPIMDLRQAVEMAKRILMKEKIGTISRTDFLDSVYEHERRFWQERSHLTQQMV